MSVAMTLLKDLQDENLLKWLEPRPESGFKQVVACARTSTSVSESTRL